MAKETGLGDNLIVDGVNLSGDIGSLSRINSLRGTTEVTGINKSAFERLYTHKDGGMDFLAWFNPTGAHPELSTLPRGDRIVSYLRGVGSGLPSASMVAKQINYDPSRPADGSLSITVVAESNQWGMDWGRQLTDGVITQSAAGSTVAIDDSATTNFGLQAFLHVLAFTGTDVTIALEHSTDDGATDPYVAIPGGTFAEVTTSPQSQRLQTSRTEAIENFVRVTTTTTGGFTNLEFIVVFTRNETEVLF